MSNLRLIALISLALCLLSCHSEKQFHEKASSSGKLYQKPVATKDYSSLSADSLLLLTKKALSDLPKLTTNKGRSILFLKGYNVGFIAPALPSTWPLSGDTVVFYVYKKDMLPTGMVRWAIGGPTHRVCFTPPYHKPAIQKLQPVKELGRQDEGVYDDSLEKLLLKDETALIKAIASHQADSLHLPAMPGYVSWLNSNQYIREDLEKRAGPFIHWILKNNATP